MPLSLGLRSIPSALQTELLARLLNHLLRGQRLATELEPLNGKRLTIEIVDTHTRLPFIIKRGRIYPTAETGSRDGTVRIRGKLAHFWQLASREEDPDTLFFNRQLQIEGKTETGLYVKNLLDSIEYDWPGHFEAVLGRRLAALPLRLFGMTRR